MSNLDELETLYNLKEKGIISAEEFEKKKGELLNNSTENQGTKNQAVYCILAFFLGGLGIHNFYAGRWKQGLVQLLLDLSSPFTFSIGFFISNIWSIINIFAIHTDGKGKEMQPCKVAKYICGILGLLFFCVPFLLIFVIGVIRGYTTAMRNYRANEIVQKASTLATTPHDANDEQSWILH